LNILVSSAGRRTSLIRGFQQSVADSGGHVIAADADPLAPGLFIADRGEVLPRLDHPEYPSLLLELCRRHEIRLLVPTIDTELELLAKMSSEFAAQGTTVLVSDVRLIEATGDKRNTEEVFSAAGIRTPRSWLVEELDGATLPPRVFVKPMRGSASLHTYVVARDQLSNVLPLVPEPIVQEHIDALEITIDVLLDMEGQVIHLVPRIRLKTVGGESVQGVTMPDEAIRPWLLAVLVVISNLGGRGPITVQAFLTAETPTLIEVNPRFGGGFPLTSAAGGDYPRWIVEMVAGGTISPRLGEYRKGLFMTRALEETFIDDGWDA
jgi:carbamoyl-phosphate synthase large subunit